MLKFFRSKKILYALSFIVFSFSFFLFSSNAVLANINGNIINWSGGYYILGSLAGTVPTGNNQILFCEIVSSNEYPTSIRWGTQELTNITKNDNVSYWYLVAPNQGNYTLGYTVPNYPLYAIHCDIIDNIDQTNPIIATSTKSNTAITTYTSQTAGNQIMMNYYSLSTATDTVTDSSGNWTQYRSDNAHARFGWIGAFYGTTDTNKQISTNIQNTAQYIITEFKNVPPSPTGTITLGTPETVYGKIGGNWNIPISWNWCGSAITPSGLYATAEDSTGTSYADGIDGESNPHLTIIPSGFIGPNECKGSGYLSGSVLTNTQSSGSGYLVLYDDNGQIATSSNFNYTINTGGQPNIYIDNSIVSPLKITTTGTGTTTLPISYNFDGLAWQGGKVCAVNLTSEEKISETCNTITATSSLININYPNPNGGLTVNLKYVLFSSGGYNLLESQPFQLIWGTGGVTNTILTNALGTSTSAIVCSTNEWATPDPVLDFGFATSSLSAFNFTKIRCSIEKSGLDIAIKIGQIPASFLKTLGNTISNIFPFNLPIGILKSWYDSETIALPSNLQFLTPEDANGNLTIEIPASIGGTTSTIEIIGPTVFQNNTNLNGMFNNIKALSTYLIWFGLIGEIFILGRNIIDDLSEGENYNIGQKEIDKEKRNK